MDLGKMLDNMLFGEVVTYNGEKYQHIQTLSNGYILAIKYPHIEPALTYVIKPEPKLKEEKK